MQNFKYWTAIPAFTCKGLGDGEGVPAPIRCTITDEAFGFYSGGPVNLRNSEFLIFIAEADKITGLTNKSALDKVCDYMQTAGVENFAALTYVSKVTHENYSGVHRGLLGRQVLVIPLQIFLRSVAERMHSVKHTPWQSLLLNTDESVTRYIPPELKKETARYGLYYQLKYAHRYSSNDESYDKIIERFFRNFNDESFMDRYVVVNKGKKVDLSLSTGICNSCPHMMLRAIDACAPCMYNCRKAREILNEVNAWKDVDDVDAHVGTAHVWPLLSDEFKDKIQLPFKARTSCIMRDVFASYDAQDAALNDEMLKTVADNDTSQLKKKYNTTSFKNNVCNGCTLGSVKNLCPMSGRGGAECTGPYKDSDFDVLVNYANASTLPIVEKSGKHITLDGKEFKIVRPAVNGEVFLAETTPPYSWHSKAVNLRDHFSDIQSDEYYADKWKSLPVITKIAINQLMKRSLDTCPQLKRNELHRFTGAYSGFATSLHEIRLDADNYLICDYNINSLVLSLKFTTVFNFNGVHNWRDTETLANTFDKDRKTCGRLYVEIGKTLNAKSPIKLPSLEVFCREIALPVLQDTSNKEIPLKRCEQLLNAKFSSNVQTTGKRGRTSKKNSVPAETSPENGTGDAAAASTCVAGLPEPVASEDAK